MDYVNLNMQTSNAAACNFPFFKNEIYEDYILVFYSVSTEENRYLNEDVKKSRKSLCLDVWGCMLL